MRLSRWCSAVVDLVLYGHFWIGAAAIAMAIQTHFLVKGEWSLSALDWFIGTGTLTIYALHRLVALYIKSANETTASRFDIINQFKTHIVAYALLAGVASAYLFFQLPAVVQWVLAAPSLIALAYVLPFLNGRRLRDLPYIKIFLVAIAWACITTIAPRVFTAGTIDAHMWAMVIERASFIFAITIPFDIRDVSMDVNITVNTIPTELGIHKAKRVAYLALVLMMLAVAYNTWFQFYSLGTALALAVSAITSTILVAYSHENRHDYYFTGLLDGTMIIQCFLVGLFN